MKATYRVINTSNITTIVEEALQARGLQRDHDRGFTARIAKVSGKGTGHCIHYALHGLTQVVNGDLVTPEIVLYNSYKGESALLITVGFIRAVCQNGMVIGDAGYYERIVHRVGDTVERKLTGIAAGIDQALDYIQAGGFSSLLNTLLLPLTVDEQIQIAVRLPGLSTRIKDAIVTRLVYPARDEDATENVWQLWNTVNEVHRQRTRSQYRQDVRNLSLLSDIQWLLDTELEVA